MAFHVHRNSFNAGEISPVMDARVDSEKYSFACRKLENFLPRVYGGAFRRPGTLYTGEERGIGTWTARADDSNISHRILDFQIDGDAPTVDDDTFYDVGSLWVRNVRSVYKATAVSSSSATWDLQNTEQNNLYALDDPTNSDDSDDGYGVDSIWFNVNTGGVFICTIDAPGAANWDQVDEQNNVTAEATPVSGTDNGSAGYAVGSVWIYNIHSLYRCSDNTSGDAVWDLQSEIAELAATRLPRGSDDSYNVGAWWVNQEVGRAWELTAKGTTAKTRLLSFSVSANDSYMLELGAGYARLWNTDGSQVLDEFNSPYTNPLTLSTPFTESEIFDVQMAQLGNLAYFAHPNHPPQKLTRTFDASYAAARFTWSEVDWSFPAFRDVNQTELTASPSQTSGKAKTISFAGGSPFIETLDYDLYNGARIMLSQKREAATEKLLLAIGTGSTDPISVLGEYEVYTFGAYTGSLTVESKDASGAWNAIRTFEATSDRQIVFRSATETATELRLTKSTSAATANAAAYIEAADSSRIGYANIINGVTAGGSDTPSISVDIELDFDSTTATTDWALESWAKYSGYPRAVAFHEQRLWFGGTELQPNTIWASRINDFENFRRGAFDDDALAFTLASDESSPIQSLLSHDALVIFTQSAEWTAATSEQTSITPSNVFVRRQSRFGAAHRQAFVANNSILFLQRGERKLREFRYSAGGAEGQASDLTMLAEHITRGGISQIAFQPHRDPTVYAINSRGELLTLTFELDQGVMGWARQTTDGEFESVATGYGDNTGSDEVWVVVKRTINGSTVRYIERLDSNALTSVESGTWHGSAFCDSALIVENDPATTAISGLDHLEGEEVQVMADGAFVDGLTVSSGSITLPDEAETVVVGLAYTSLLQPSKVELQMQNGTAQSRHMTCKQLLLNLWKTFGIEHSDDDTGSAWFESTLTDSEAPDGEGPELFTGLVDVTNQGSNRRSIDISIRQARPFPAAILAMIPQIHVSDS